jgi:hypothetical protein
MTTHTGLDSTGQPLHPAIALPGGFVVWFEQATNILAYNNLIYNNFAGGFSVGGGSSHCRVYNTVVVPPRPVGAIWGQCAIAVHGSAGGRYYMPLAHNRVYNNIFVSAAKQNEGAIAALQLANSEQTWVTDNILDRNCYWNTDPAAVPDFQLVVADPVTHNEAGITPWNAGYIPFAQWQSSFAVDHGGTHTAQDLNSIIADPQFVGSTQVPGPNSPVLLKGLHLVEVMDDFNGAFRPSAPFFPYALGAFQPAVPETIAFGTSDGRLTYRPGPIRKLTDESIASDNTLNDDPTLKFTMAPNTKYNIRLKVFFSTTATADFKY